MMSFGPLIDDDASRWLDELEAACMSERGTPSGLGLRRYLLRPAFVQRKQPPAVSIHA